MSVVAVVRMTCMTLLVSLLLGLLVPPGSAQAPLQPAYHVQAQVAYDETPVEPLTEQRVVAFEVSVHCHSAGVEHDLEPHRLRYTISTDRAWATATLSKTEDAFTFEPKECLDQAIQTFPVQAEIMFDRYAPAFWHTNFRFQAMMETGEHVQLEFILRAAFTGQWEARVDTPILQAPTNALVDIPVQIVNHGNGPIFIHWKPAEGTSRSLGVAIPPPQVVPSVIAGGETSELVVPVTVLTPRGADQNLALDLTLIATSADDPTTRLGSKQVSAIVQSSGANPEMSDVGELPSLSASFVAVLAGIAAFLARRRT